MKTHGRGGFDEIDKTFSKKLCSLLSIDSNDGLKIEENQSSSRSQIKRKKINKTQEILSYQKEILQKKLYIFRDKQGRPDQLINYKGEKK